MAVQTPPYCLQAASHSAELFRRALQAQLPVGSGGGIIPATAVSTQVLAGDLQVSAPVSGMSVNVAPGQALVPGSLGGGSGYGMPLGYGAPQINLNGALIPNLKIPCQSVQLTAQGLYYCYNDDSAGPVSLAVAASSASNPRIDIVGCQVEDAQYAGSSNDWKLAVVTGTAAASPVVPSLPANFLPLALVWVPTLATSVLAANILDLRVSAFRCPLGAQAYQTTTQFTTITSGVPVPIRLDTLLYDPAGGFSISTYNYRCAMGGIYTVRGSVGLVPNGSGPYDEWVSILHNGAEAKRGASFITALSSAGSVEGLNVAGDLICAAGDTIGLAATLISPGVNVDTVAGSSITFLDIAYASAT
ncbi:MAG: hypothetical protein ACRDYC_05620 [Acidimicrobiales bacterium]